MQLYILKVESLVSVESSIEVEVSVSVGDWPKSTDLIIKLFLCIAVVLSSNGHLFCTTVDKMVYRGCWGIFFFPFGCFNST